ncbi:hypothetical protein [Cellulosimicrobium protaetiae]|uniref:Uncharacterized protein n=1 Tax=Cellulosimicrobium protaetiae TaxID=2587808 RepID=A0A6M5ULA9_9MICO|nr:hypothetical protein [Cellulosimicrobium protaetiae]QJW38774.1 hypothetical protein FIC82_020545 [Cellulosimicrobium protaetiae]
MSTDNTGAARPIPAGRLASFEDADDEVSISLPPRRPRAPKPEPVAPVTLEAVPSLPEVPQDEPAPRLPKRRSSTSTSAKASPAREAAPEATAAEEAGEQGSDAMRPSNVHIPVFLLDPIRDLCAKKGLSHGEVIIIALEDTHPRLRELVNPVATAGGSLFAARRSRASRSADGPLTPLNYRLRESDYATLDRLAAEFGASSRGHLITEALKGYFGLTEAP